MIIKYAGHACFKILDEETGYSIVFDPYEPGSVKGFGDIRDALRMFRAGERKVSMIKAMFRILANSGRKRAGLEENVSADVIDSCSLADMSRIARALNQTMEEAMRAETVNGGEADDEVHDEYLRGMRAVEYYGYALIAGIGHDEAAGMLPGYILDMYMIRLRYDARLAGANMEKRAFG